MVRWSLALVALAGLVAAEDMPEAPDVQFRELTWWAPSTAGIYGWWPGQDGSAYAANLGRICPARILGPQELVWNHRFYPIESVKLLEDQLVLVGFSQGTLAMRKISGLRWEIAFTPVGTMVPMGVFRTLSSLEVTTGTATQPAPVTPPDPRLWRPNVGAGTAP